RRRRKTGHGQLVTIKLKEREASMHEEGKGFKNKPHTMFSSLNSVLPKAKVNQLISQ
ncbi:hypothetical protein A2U01_0071096, partial [Trifolium medium]|nr:hypothetical protein [Trifolium medium]